MPSSDQQQATASGVMYSTTGQPFNRTCDSCAERQPCDHFYDDRHDFYLCAKCQHDSEGKR